jgi:hypothetical protein
MTIVVLFPKGIMGVARGWLERMMLGRAPR